MEAFTTPMVTSSEPIVLFASSTASSSWAAVDSGLSASNMTAVVYEWSCVAAEGDAMLVLYLSMSSSWGNSRGGTCGVLVTRDVDYALRVDQTEPV